MDSSPIELQTLRACAEADVAYEIEQFVIWLLTAPPLHPRPDIDVRLRQACFEVSVLHLRNLVDFLANPRPTSKKFATDLVADHYFDKGWGARPNPCLLYDSGSEDANGAVQRNVNRHLAHITTDRHRKRAAATPFEWDAVDPRLLLTTFVRFVDDLAVEHPDRARWFDDARTNAATALQILTAHPGRGPQLDAPPIRSAGPLDPAFVERSMT